MPPLAYMFVPPPEWTNILSLISMNPTILASSKYLDFRILCVEAPSPQTINFIMSFPPSLIYCLLS